jgi:hypothetical protein
MISPGLGLVLRRITEARDPGHEADGRETLLRLPDVFLHCPRLILHPSHPPQRFANGYIKMVPSTFSSPFRTLSTPQAIPGFPGATGLIRGLTLLNDDWMMYRHQIPPALACRLPITGTTTLADRSSLHDPSTDQLSLLLITSPSLQR